MKKDLERLLKAAEEVWEAYLAWGPVNDGTKAGERFEKALDDLSEIETEIKANKS